MTSKVPLRLYESVSCCRVDILSDTFPFWVDVLDLLWMAEFRLLGGPPWMKRPDEMSIVLLCILNLFPTTGEMPDQLLMNTIQMFSTEVKKKVLSSIELSSCWTWLMLHEVGLPRFEGILFQPDEEPCTPQR